MEEFYFIFFWLWLGCKLGRMTTKIIARNSSTGEQGDKPVNNEPKGYPEDNQRERKPEPSPEVSLDMKNVAVWYPDKGGRTWN